MAPISRPGKRGKPAQKNSKDEVLAVRLDNDVTDEIDAYVEALRGDSAYTGLSVSRADAVRRLLALGLLSEKARME
jgi:hypothetical protein